MKMKDTRRQFFRCVRLLALPALALAILGCGPSEAESAKRSVGVKSSGGLHVVMETSQGTIEFELLEKDAPTTVENFRLLAERGYYTGVTFHRIVKGFM